MLVSCPFLTHSLSPTAYNKPFWRLVSLCLSQRLFKPLSSQARPGRALWQTASACCRPRPVFLCRNCGGFPRPYLLPQRLRQNKRGSRKWMDCLLPILRVCCTTSVHNNYRSKVYIKIVGLPPVHSTPKTYVHLRPSHARAETWSPGPVSVRATRIAAKEN